MIGEEGHQLAIIKGVTFGIDDRDRVSLKFSTYVTEGSAASQWIWDWDQIQAIIKDAYVEDVHKLEGQPCWVDTSDVGVIKFVGIAKI